MASETAWADTDFGAVALGDKRLNRRAVQIAKEAFANPAGQVTQVCRSAASLEATFRFLNNPRVDLTRLGEAPFQASAQGCAGHEVVIVPLDQSTLSVTDRTGAKGFCRVGSTPSRGRRGVEVMTALAMTPEGCVLGVCAQQWWLRPEARSPDYVEDRRPVHARESGLWTRTIEQAESLFERSAPRTRRWYQLDRGGDAWHVLLKASREDLLLTVRAAYNRRLDDEHQTTYLFETLSQQKPLGRYACTLSPDAARRAGHSKHRARQLEVRACPVTLRVVDTLTRTPVPVSCWAVDVWERRPPSGCSRLHWRLLTTYPVDNADDAVRVIQGYACRWRIEEFHRTWKSGCCDIERSQLRSCAAFQRWATLMAAVASRVEQLKSARSDRKLNALELATRDEIDAAILLSETKKFKIGRKLTAEQFVTLVAQVGGYTGKSSGGPPGAQTIARGLERVVYTAKGIGMMRKM